MKASNNLIPILVAVLIALLVLVTVLTTVKRDSSDIVVRSFPTSIVVDTNLDMPYVNLISKTIAYNVLELDSITVMVLNMGRELPEKDGIRIDAFVIKVPYEEHSYIISISQRITNRARLIQILSHEFAHIKQFETGQMEVVNFDKGIYTWEGDTLDLSKISYEDRLMEQDAFIQGRRIEFAVTPLLYNK